MKLQEIPWAKDTGSRVASLDDGAARSALITQFHRVRLLSIAALGQILFLGLLLVNVFSPRNPLDTAIWDFFLSLRAGWLDPVIAFFTQAFNTLPDTVYALLAVVLIGIKRKSFWPLVTIGLSMILSPLAMMLVKRIIDRERPPLWERLVEETSFSFPSGHSTGIAALCFSVYLALHAILSRSQRRLVGLVLALLALAVALSRLYVGVHWASDILAGLTLGTTVTCLVYAVFPKILLEK